MLSFGNRIPFVPTLFANRRCELHHSRQTADVDDKKMDDKKIHAEPFPYSSTTKCGGSVSPVNAWDTRAKIRDGMDSGIRKCLPRESASYCATRGRYISGLALGILLEYDFLTMTTILSKKGQIVLPGAIRERLGLEPGQDFEVFVEDDDTIVLRRISRPPNRGLVDHLIACPSPFEVPARARDAACPLDL